MDKELRDKVKKAAKYIKNGDPLKDVMNVEDVEECIIFLAEIFKRIRD